MAPEPSLGVLQAEATALSKAVGKMRGGSPHPQRAPSLVRAGRPDQLPGAMA